MLNGLDLFSGIGGLSLALTPYVRPLAYCENDRFCQAVLLSRQADGVLPAAPIWDDVRTFPSSNLIGGVDLVYGGFPCQDISHLGVKAGLGGERSILFFEVIRLVRDLRPTFVFLENVPYICQLGLDRVVVELTTLGYDLRWTVISAGQLGAPHVRERWWLLAYSDRAGFQITRGLANAEGEYRAPSGDTSFGLVQRRIWRTPISVVRGMDDGLYPKTHRIKSLGNAVVPYQARYAFEKLMGIGNYKEVANYRDLN